MKFKSLQPLTIFALLLVSLTAHAFSEKPVFRKLSGYWQGVSMNAEIIKGYVDSTGVFRLLGLEGCQADGLLLDEGSERFFRTNIELSKCEQFGGEKLVASTTFEAGLECKETLHGTDILRLDIEIEGTERVYKLCRAPKPISPKKHEGEAK